MNSSCLAVLGLGLAVWGCSSSGPGADSGKPNATGGSPTSAGSSGSASAAAGASAGAGNGGSSGTGTGGTSAGGASTGGTSAGGASTGGTSDLPDMSACPPWPRARLMPLVGPFFYGPDRGPCSYRTVGGGEPTTVTYGYQGDNVQTEQQKLDAIITPQYNKTYVSDAEGKLVSSSSEDGLETFDYGADYLLYSLTRGGLPTEQVRYTLNARGYPVRAAITIGSQGSRTASYRYEGCRLAGRTISDVNGAVIEELAYTYDSAGHLSSRLGADGAGDMYDYSCW
jgi:YD repeat-containing protein